MAIIRISKKSLVEYEGKLVGILPTPKSQQEIFEIEVPDEVVLKNQIQYVLDTYAYLKRRPDLIGKNLDWYKSEQHVQMRFRVCS